MQRRVLIADDQARARSGLQALLALRPEIEVIGEAANGREALRWVEESQPDVVLMDAKMPVMDGLEVLRIIKARWPAVKVVVLTIHTAL
jgi:YesN/AraC family two-component response regulator